MIRMVIGFVVIALLGGFLARALVPGKDSMSIGQTLLLGAVGSFVGGFLGYLIFHKDKVDGGVQSAGLIGSVLGSVVVLLLYKKFGKQLIKR